jgi:3-phytase
MSGAQTTALRRLAAAMFLLTVACGLSERRDEPAKPEAPAPKPPAFDAQVRLDPRLVADLQRAPEQFRTQPLSEAKDVDSLAIWRRDPERTWLLVTKKRASEILVLDAATGELLETIGAPGEELGRFDRPNGIAVIDDLLLVVERENRRVQVLRLPDFEPLGAFGQDLLEWPYGVTVDRPGNWYEVYVTDSYDSPEHEPPTPEVCANRVRHYRFRTTEEGLEAELVRSFGDPSGEGALYRVESIVIDRPLGRLYISDESRQRLNLKAYSLDGRFLASFGNGLQYREPEGLALIRCGAEDPADDYVIVADQTQPTRFLVYDRQSLEHVGGFTGEPTIDISDGTAFGTIWDGEVESAWFYATHHDVQVVGYRWEDIAKATGLRSDCR